MRQANWISPVGLDYVVSHSHIRFVYDRAKLFGITQEHIEAIYARHGERLGIEGKASDQILLDVVKEGWIRIRENRNHWVVQGWEFSLEAFERIGTWAAQGLDQQRLYPEDTLQLLEIKSARTRRFHAGALAKLFSLQNRLGETLITFDPEKFLIEFEREFPGLLDLMKDDR